jgi:glycosyltransferase involved in cell wall biosynthesis
MTTSRRVRVLVNGLHAKSGGGITYLRNILPRLADDSDLDIHLFLHEDQADLLAPIDDRVRVHLMSFKGGTLRLLLWEQLCLPILARMMSVDVTYSPANYGPLAAPRPVILLRNSLAVVGRETRFFKRLYWATLALMTLASLLAARRAIAVSSYARDALTLGLDGLMRHRVTIIPHGVAEQFRPADSTLAPESYLLAVSDIYIQKNLHSLIGVMKRLRSRFPGLSLKIAGSPIDPGYFQELKSLIDREGLSDSVEFLGRTEPAALVGLYQRCLVFVFPSTVETFGNPLTEAMACGAPIAASRTSAMPEIVGDAAQYFDPLDLHGIEIAIAGIIEDPELRQAMTKRGLMRAKKFSWHITARETAALLKQAALDPL